MPEDPLAPHGATDLITTLICLFGISRRPRCSSAFANDSLFKAGAGHAGAVQPAAEVAGAVAHRQAWTAQMSAATGAWLPRRGLLRPRGERCPARCFDGPAGRPDFTHLACQTWGPFRRRASSDGT